MTTLSTQWDQAHAAFRTAIDVNCFFESLTHVEALSRMLYLVEENRRLATLAGPAGAGKSFLLRSVVRQLRRTQRLVVLVDLGGLDDRQFLWNLAATLRLGPGDSDSVSRLWRMTEDYLRGLRRSGLQRLFLFDHVDRAVGDCLRTLERVLQIDAGESSQIAAIVAAESFDRDERLTPIVDLRDLAISLSAFERTETGQYIRARLAAAGCDQLPFAEDAIDEVCRQSGGIPRQINALCELAILAARQLGCESVDRAAVTKAAEERPASRGDDAAIPLLFESA